MAERGARPRVPAVRRRLLRAAGVFFTPLLPDDYLELIDPLWSSRELRGRIESITRETADSVTVTIRPGWVWEGHAPGRYLRVGVVVVGGTLVRRRDGRIDGIDRWGGDRIRTGHRVAVGARWEG